MKIMLRNIAPIKFASAKPSLTTKYPNDEFIQSNDEYKLFFANINHCGKNSDWALQMLDLRNDMADLINNDASFFEIIKTAQDRLPGINKHPYFPEIFGKFRQDEDDFENAYYDVEKDRRGEEYFEKYVKLTTDGDFSPKTNKEYKDASVCTLKYCKSLDCVQILYGYKDENSSNNLELAKNEYDKLKSIKNPNLNQINKSCATIHWLMAQASPFIRGNDSMANLVTKSIYKAYGVELSPTKSGKNFDFEAFSTNLDDYIKNYPKIFKNEPKFN